jgi:PAS domain S-box-containing protein
VKNNIIHKSVEDLLRENEELRYELNEAQETIEAIRTGQVDALIVQGEGGHRLYTLKSADQTYRVFIEKMTEGAVTLSPEGVILYCNSRFAALVDRPLSQVIGMPFEAFIDSGSNAQYRELFHKCWRADCKGEVWLRSGSSNTPVQLSLTTLELQEGKSLSIILTDLTQQKKNQEQLLQNNLELEQTNRALESSNHDLLQFASITSHDLQEPLRKIHIFSNLLNDRENLSPEARVQLQKIIQSAQRMKALIVDILTYSKLSDEDQHLEPVELREIVEGLKDDFELVIGEKNAIINIGALPVIEGNRGQLRQVFQNIIGNALKFSQAGLPPVISIDSKRIAQNSFESIEHEQGAYYLISVRDNGIGFKEEYVDNVFSLFKRLNPKDKYEGTGIGLAIAKRIVEKHEGQITALGHPGDGAEFQIILPIQQQPES